MKDTITKKAIEYLTEKSVAINEHSLKRAISYFKNKSHIKENFKERARRIDSSFMKFLNNYEKGEITNEDI